MLQRNLATVANGSWLRQRASLKSAGCVLQKRWHKQPVRRKWEEVRIPVPWGHIAGKKWGDPEDVPVIALHGWRDTAGSFDAMAPLLDFNFLALDLPGHGLSSHMPMGTNAHWVDYVVMLRMVVQHLGFEGGKISLIGHSVGSTMSIAYAGLYPDQVDRFVSMECGRAHLYESPAKFASMWGPLIDTLLGIETKMIQVGPPELPRDELLKRYRKGAFMSPSPEATEVLMERGALPSKTEEGKFAFSYDPRVRMDSFKRPYREVLMALSANIRCRVLNVLSNPGLGFGKRPDYGKTLELMKQNAEKFDFQELPGTHHFHMNNPERISQLINKFMST